MEQVETFEIDLTPTLRGYAASLAALIRDADWEGRTWALNEMIRIFEAANVKWGKG